MFDIVRFLDDKFGTPAAIVGLAAHYKVDVPVKDTVRKWFQRGTISGEWFPVLLVLLELENGSAASLKDYLPEVGGNYDIFD